MMYLMNSECVGSKLFTAGVRAPTFTYTRTVKIVWPGPSKCMYVQYMFVYLSIDQY